MAKKLYQSPEIDDYTNATHDHKSVADGGILGTVYKASSNADLLLAFASTDASITIVLEAAFNWSSATYTIVPERVQVIGSYFIGIASNISFINGSGVAQTMHIQSPVTSNVSKVIGYETDTLAFTLNILSIFENVTTVGLDFAQTGTGVFTVNYENVTNTIALTSSGGAVLSKTAWYSAINQNYINHPATLTRSITTGAYIKGLDSKREYNNITAGSTGNLTINFDDYPLLSGEKLLIIYNARPADAVFVFPTANILSGGITYTFHCSTADLTIPTLETAEINLLFQYIDATNIQIRINSGNYSFISV